MPKMSVSTAKSVSSDIMYVSTKHIADACLLLYYTTAACLDGDLRLVDGDTKYSGLVEVCFSQRWGTVNGDGWTSVDTQIVCKQLGYLSTGN